MSIKKFHNHQSKVFHQNILNTQSNRCDVVQLIEKINLEKKVERKKNVLFFFSFVSVVALVVSAFSLVH
jgi:hypothetical protein